ncbi:putative ribonuclease H-like domain-containing protein [Tanacetum coccineum]
MSKTRADYGSGIVRTKIEDTDSIELKGQFLKELHDNTFSGSDHKDANEHIKKVLKIVDLFQIPNITIYQVMLRAFPMSLTGAASRWLRNKPFGSITTWEDLKIKFLSKYCAPAQIHEVVLFYNGLDVPTRQILDSRGAIPSKTAADAKVAIQEMVPTTPKIVHSKKKGKPSKKLTTHNLVHLFKEGDIEQLLRDFIKGTTRILPDSSSIRHMGSSQYAISTGQNRALMYETKQTTIPFPSRLNGYYYEEKKGSYGPQFSEAYSKASHINNSIPRKEKDLGSFSLPCFINNVCFDNALADVGASTSVMPLSTYLNLGLGELAHIRLTVELAYRTVKYPKGIAKNVLVGIGKFIFPVDFIILDMPKDIKVPLILGRPFLSTAHAKIDVFKRKITLRVGEEKIIFKSKVIEEFRARNDARMVSKVLRYPSDCDHDKKIHIDCAYNLKFSCMIVLEDMDAYRNEGMGDVSFGEPFLREVGINAKRFEGMITIKNGNEKVTYQMCMKGSSTKELFTPFKDPEREFRSYRKHFKTLSLDESRSPDFDLFSDQEKYPQEEVAKTMAETMKNKPSGSTTTWEDPKTKFLSKYCPPARTVKKMKEINNFQQKPNENLYQAWERFKKVLNKVPQHYLTEMREVVLFYNGLDVPTRQTIDSRGVIPSKTPAESKKWLNTLKNSTMNIKTREI